MLNSYYIIEGGQQTGPFSHTELMERGLPPETLILSPIANDWQNAIDLPEFSNYFESQGIYFPTKANTANFWWRLLAWFIDYIFFLVLVVALGTLSGLISAFTTISVDYDFLDSFGYRLSFYVALTLYNASFESTRLQGSIGKLICKLKVVNAGGGRISFFTALGRNVAKILSSLLCGIGFLNIFWSDRKQAWHDQAAKTFVIRKAD